MEHGAGDGDRTRDLHLGKVSLYQLSHSRPSQGILYTIEPNCRIVTLTGGLFNVLTALGSGHVRSGMKPKRNGEIPNSSAARAEAHCFSFRPCTAHPVCIADDTCPCPVGADSKPAHRIQYSCPTRASGPRTRSNRGSRRQERV